FNLYAYAVGSHSQFSLSRLPPPLQALWQRIVPLLYSSLSTFALPEYDLGNTATLRRSSRGAQEWAKWASRQGPRRRARRLNRPQARCWTAAAARCAAPRGSPGFGGDAGA